MIKFQDGDLVQLIDSKNRKKLIKLDKNKIFFSHSGGIPHSEIIGLQDGSIIETPKGTKYLAISPLGRDYVLAMKRGAAIIYPKDSALIISFADITSGDRVLEAGVGSGSLSISILKALAGNGKLVSYERRAEFAEIAKSNVLEVLPNALDIWTLKVEDVLDAKDEEFDQIILDMLEPWEVLPKVINMLTSGGVICVYVATTTQMSETVAEMRRTTKLTEPEVLESIIRPWHVEGLAVRPEHRMIGHTGFLIFSRKMAQGNPPLVKRRKIPNA